MSIKKTLYFHYDGGDTYQIKMIVSNEREEFFDITYDSYIVKGDDLIECKKIKDLTEGHPFFGTNHDIDGVIVAKNKITAAQIEYIMMDDEELEKHSGCTIAQDYRAILMDCLQKLWD